MSERWRLPAITKFDPESAARSWRNPPRPLDGVFVSRAGDDHAAGTRDAPVRSLERGLALASERGARRLFLSGGEFEGGFKISVSLFGGFDPGTWRLRPGEETRIKRDAKNDVLSAWRGGEGAVLSRLTIENAAGDGVGSPLVPFVVVECRVRAAACAVGAYEGLVLIDSEIDGGWAGIQTGSTAHAFIARSRVTAQAGCRAGIELNGGGVVTGTEVRIGAGKGSHGIYAQGPARLADNRIVLPEGSENSLGIWAADESVKLVGNFVNGAPFPKWQPPASAVGRSWTWEGSCEAETCYVRIGPGGLYWWGESEYPHFVGPHSGSLQTFEDFRAQGPRSMVGAPPQRVLDEIVAALGTVEV